MANQNLQERLTLPSGRQLTVPTGLFINNEFVASESQEQITVINPATEEVICQVQQASAKDVDAAVASARKAFEGPWRSLPPSQRARLIFRLADLMERDAQELAELESLNNGKAVDIAREGDLVDSIECMRYFAGWCDKLTGQTIQTDNPTKFAFTRHEPVGVCGQIIPFNYPIMMWSWKTAPALAVGCTVIMKPSELTPLTALKLCELVVEAGFPPGVLNCIPSVGAVGGAALSSHPGVDKIAFTGSTATGRKIMEASAKSNLKKVTLELGGKSPHIIFPSADLDRAAESVGLGVFYNMGQDCTAGSRVYVHSSIYDKFMEKLVEMAKVWDSKIGDPSKKGIESGPLVSQAQRDKVWGYIESGKTQGATLAHGGKKWEGKGWYQTTTIFGDVTPDMRIVKEEIFGPVLSVGKFDTEEEAIQLANDTTYGLGSGIQSNDPSQIIRVSSALQAGTVWVNQYNILHNNVPFGGYKQSGIGRELSGYALSEYTSVKAVHWDFS